MKALTVTSLDGRPIVLKQVTRNVVDQFRTPKKTLGDLDAEDAAKLVAASSDIAVVIDSKGVVRDVAFGSDECAKEGYESWIGRRWVDTVTSETRVKVEDLLKDAATKAQPKWRQVNHPSARGPDVPIQYSAIALGATGRVIAVGRDLRAMAVMQQRLVDTQQSIERDYARVRHAETRYRLLFQISSEAVLVVDGMSGLIVEANPAAARVTGKAAKRLAGRSFPEMFEGEDAKKVHANLTTVRSAGRADPVEARLTEGNQGVTVSATAFRHDNALHFLVRLTPAALEDAGGPRARLIEVVEKLPDGFVVTDTDRRILSANAAFLEFVQAGSVEQILGERLDKWIGRHSMEMNVLVTNLRENGSVRHFATLLRGEFESSEEVEISAVSVTGGDTPCLGFTIRSVARRPSYIVNGHRDMPRSVEQLTQLVGRVSLKDLVRESTDVIERLCIEAALELTGDNRASAADLLGLSRQSLYSKLRRHGLGDLDSGPGFGM